MDPSRPSLLDVARHAGVSAATVSRVMNRTGQVSQRTQDRVLAAVAALGYEPMSSRVSTPSLRTIAVVITDILNPFFPEIVRGIEDEARPEMPALLLCNTVEDPQLERQTLRMLGERRVDGVIVCASRLTPVDLIGLHEKHGLPMVVIGRRVEHGGIPNVLVDAEGAMYRAAQHLLALQHTRIAYLAGPAGQGASLERRRGVERALGEAGLALRPEWCPASFPNVDGGFQAMSALLACPTDRPTAVVAYNDMLALGALHAIRTHGLRVPEDVSVIGYDDIAMAAHANPPLTTISIPKYRMGKLAMQVLRQMTMGETVNGNGYMLLESPLVVRASTAVVASADGNAVA
jgi:LacI family transcriptional regulator